MKVYEPDYMAGMIRSEAINYVKHLPDLTSQEYDALMAVAEARPVTRPNTLGRSTSNAIMDTRIEKLVEYMQDKLFIRRSDLLGKWNGKNTYDVLREAQARNVIMKVRTGKRFIYTLAQGAKR